MCLSDSLRSREKHNWGLFQSQFKNLSVPNRGALKIFPPKVPRFIFPQTRHRFCTFRHTAFKTGSKAKHPPVNNWFSIWKIDSNLQSSAQQIKSEKLTVQVGAFFTLVGLPAIKKKKKKQWHIHQGKKKKSKF